MNCVLGIDIGTTSTIGILIALPDKVLAQTSRPVAFLAPLQGWAEEDPNQWWDNLCSIIPDLIAQSGITASDIKGVGVTGMLPALVLLVNNEAILRPSIQQSDGRAGTEVADAHDRHRDAARCHQCPAQAPGGVVETADGLQQACRDARRAVPEIRRAHGRAMAPARGRHRPARRP